MREGRYRFRFAVVHIFKGAFVSHKLLPSILLAPEGSRPSHEQRQCADARSGEAGARYASGRQEARADDRYAARYRQFLTASASRATRARTATRDSTHGGQPWRTALADGVRAGRRDLARDRRYGADADEL